MRFKTATVANIVKLECSLNTVLPELMCRTSMHNVSTVLDGNASLANGNRDTPTEITTADAEFDARGDLTPGYTTSAAAAAAAVVTVMLWLLAAEIELRRATHNTTAAYRLDADIIHSPIAITSVSGLFRQGGHDAR